MILTNLEEKHPEEYTQMKQNGTLEKEADKQADQMLDEVNRLTKTLEAKNGGQARMIAEEMVFHDFLT